MAGYQRIIADSSFRFRAGQLPPGFPRERVVQNMTDSGHESQISEEEYEILHNDDYIAHMVNDEIIATVVSNKSSKETDIIKAQQIAENYGTGNPLPSEINQLNREFSGEDFISVHRDGDMDYVRNGRDSVQPNFAFLKGSMSNGFQTAFVFDSETVAEGVQESLNEESGGQYYSKPLKRDSNVIIADGKSVGIEVGMDGFSNVIGYPELM